MAKKAITKRADVVVGRRSSKLSSRSSDSHHGSIERTGASSGRWTFLTNHTHVLILLARNPSMTLREVATVVGITERAVQRIIAELEEDGFIEREKIGRQNHYLILSDQHLRHPIEAHRTIGDLIKMIDKGT